MRPSDTTRRHGRADSGYTIIELLISTALMVTITGAVFALMNPSQGNAKVQPEVADMQQRMRVASDILFRELVMTGAGPYQGSDRGTLLNFFAPILPRRVGDVSPDPTTGANSFKTDKITLAYIPNSYSQTTISQDMPTQSAELKVNPQVNCPADAGNLCGFTDGMKVIIFDTMGDFDTFVITHVQDAAAHIQHRGQDLNYPYDHGAQVTQIVSNTYWLDRTTNQLMKYDGGSTDLPLVDDVVDLKFEYFGDPVPPQTPKPIDSTKANCLYAAGGTHVAMATLTPTDGSLAELTAGMLTDGPYCGNGDTAFDADLLRIRKVRVTLRMQVQSSSLRGTNTGLFMKPGTAQGGERYVPDYKVTFEVSPRNLNLSR